MIEEKTETFLEELSTEELQAEIDKRKEEERKLSLPYQILVLDTKPLRAICQNYIDDLSENHYVREDAEHYIFEEAMETVFGKEVGKFINSIV